MKNGTHGDGGGRVNTLVYSRIKNPDLVKKKHLHIAKKAAKLFIKKGYPQTTMRDIAKAAGMAVGNLYDYISKKEDLLCLVFDVYHQHMEETINQGTYDSHDKDPAAILRLFIHNSIENVHHFRDEIVLMYRESRLLPKPYLERAMQQERREIAALERLIQNGVDQGVFHVKEPFFAASMIFFQLTIPALRGWTFRNQYTADQVNRLMEEYILKPLTA